LLCCYSERVSTGLLEPENKTAAWEGPSDGKYRKQTQERRGC
jgi:hypothetical protein